MSKNLNSFIRNKHPLIRSNLFRIHRKAKPTLKIRYLSLKRISIAWSTMALIALTKAMESSQQLWRPIRASYSIVRMHPKLINLTSNRIISLPIQMNKRLCRFSKNRLCNTTSSMGWPRTSSSRCSSSSSNSNNRCNSNRIFNTPITKITPPLSTLRTQCLMWSSMEVILECLKIYSIRTVQNQQQERIRTIRHFTIIKGRKLLISPHRIIGSSRTTQSTKSKRLLLLIWLNHSRISLIAR